MEVVAITASLCVHVYSSFFFVIIQWYFFLHRWITPAVISIWTSLAECSCSSTTSIERASMAARTHAFTQHLSCSTTSTRKPARLRWNPSTSTPRGIRHEPGNESTACCSSAATTQLDHSTHQLAVAPILYIQNWSHLKERRLLLVFFFFWILSWLTLRTFLLFLLRVHTHI